MLDQQEGAGVHMIHAGREGCARAGGAAVGAPGEHAVQLGHRSEAGLVRSGSRFGEANSRGLVCVLQAVELLKGWRRRKSTGAGQGPVKEVTAALAGTGAWVPAPTHVGPAPPPRAAAFAKCSLYV